MVTDPKKIKRKLWGGQKLVFSEMNRCHRTTDHITEK